MMLSLGTAATAVGFRVLEMPHGHTDDCDTLSCSTASTDAPTTDCLSHCLAQGERALPAAPPIAVLAIICLALAVSPFHRNFVKRKVLSLERRLTEGIERMRLSAELQTVIIRD